MVILNKKGHWEPFHDACDNEYCGSSFVQRGRQCSFISCRANSDKNIESKEGIELFPRKFSMTFVVVLDMPR